MKIRLDPVRFFGLIGGVVAFVASGAIVAVLWTAVGIAVGAFVGMFVQRLLADAGTHAEALDLEEHATRDDLYEQARELGIDGRSSMDRAELAEAVARRRRR
jgi:hypothetical protein